MIFCNFQAIGLVENQSDWYLGKLWKNHQPWPALVSAVSSCVHGCVCAYSMIHMHLCGCGWVCMCGCDCVGVGVHASVCVCASVLCVFAYICVKTDVI